MYLDDDTADDVLVRRLYYGLMYASGMRSDNGAGLKRSARHAMNLLKWLLTDWKDSNNNATETINSTGEALNLFARAFLALPVQYYKASLNLNLHVVGDDRGGAKEDACAIVVLILCHHTDPEGSKPQTVLLEELVTTPVAQQAYDLWSARSSSVTVQQQDLIKKNTLQRQAEIALQQRQEALLSKSSNVNASMIIGGGVDDLDMIIDDSDNNPDASENAENNNDADDYNNDNNNNNNAGTDDDSDIDELDVMAAIRKRQKAIRKELAAMGGGGNGGGVATRWQDSQLAREQVLREKAAAAAANSTSSTVRDSVDAAQELQRAQDEKAKTLGKDPLGIVISKGGGGSNDDDGNGEEQFDLRTMENAQAEQIELALHEAQDEIQKAESAGVEELLKKSIMQKESLEQLVEKLGGLEAMENHNSKASILPTRSNFNPLLFLTLLHRKTAYKDLVASMDRLSSTCAFF